MNEPFGHQFSVPFHQVDQAGILFYAHLFTHAHQAYAALMNSCSFSLPEILERGQYFVPIAHAEADYLSPLRHGEAVVVEVWVESSGNSSVTFQYVFNTEGQTRATARTTHVFIDPRSGNPVPIPQALLEQLAAYTRPEQ